MTTAQNLGTPLPVGATVVPGTLRARMEELRAQGAVLTLKQAIGIIVPLAVDIAKRHDAGEKLYVHPSSVVADESSGRYQVSPGLASRPPTLPRDKACQAPEQRIAGPGDARASVFAIGAMLYELVTGLPVGPGMRRPTEVVPALPPALEVVLGKSLVADATHRPGDLRALAQAIHHLEPTGSLAPPPADESHLDHGEGFEVDVSMSMLPPGPSTRIAVSGTPASPYGIAVRQQPAPQQQQQPTQDDFTNELSLLKQRLEADPRPRYVVIKDGMDHGPFSAVELLQQIASHTFLEHNYIRDTFSNDERSIKDWDEFAPFAEHARLHRDIKAEKEAIERVVVAESRSTRSKALLGVAVVGALLVAAAVWFLTQRGRRADEIGVFGDTTTNVEVDGGLKVSKSGKAGGRRVVGSQGGFPILAGGMSCEAAQNAYVEEMNVGGPRGQADITGGQYGSVLNRGGYFAHCGVPDDMNLDICAAVQNGRAVGVSVRTTPSNPRVAGCVSAGVRGLSFPSHPKLDVTRTRF